ncbi:rhodanese-like domain-containing protein [Pollutimonas harenae]|uniref:VTT domain-containing protein n=1 Tax=Pollutimonas harenae TaxID=657015 RepID=A0A853GTG7_9BURK|nr:rhodanese-like domain-containing protein [Pollutimonas harenae]NYT85457.1 VTT domain-containing protein [Pollutimonas harenae]TEA71497.1 sulfurtransferase [Pollutimonas harenae]
MEAILRLIEEYGLLIVFFNVLIEQAGAPIPAYPILVVTGALHESSGYSPLALVGVAVLGAMIADYGWYLAGRRYGARLLSMLCRISLSPDSCIQQTESIYVRWGAPSLMVAKFIPGFASIASVLAGAVHTRKRSFLLFDIIGATIWSGSAVYLGSLFSTAVDELLEVLVNLGMLGALLLAAALVVFVARKWWQRHRFIKSLCMERVSVQELHDMLQSGNRPVIVDVRSAVAQAEGRIPGAIALRVGEDDFPPLSGDDIIVYCDCPHDASAAAVSKRLMQSGYSRVRPLAGGIEAWLAAGYTIDIEVTEAEGVPA